MGIMAHDCYCPVGMLCTTLCSLDSDFIAGPLGRRAEFLQSITLLMLTSDNNMRIPPRPQTRVVEIGLPIICQVTRSYAVTVQCNAVPF